LEDLTAYRRLRASVCTSRVEGLNDDRQARTGRARVRRKNHLIDVSRLERTRRILRTRTETETILLALDLVLDEAALVEALHRFVLKGRGHVEDVDARR
jgi:hypothetical protein